MYTNLVKIATFFGTGGAIFGAGEVYQQRKLRMFSNNGDTIHEGAARGIIRSVIFIGKTIQEIPKILGQEWGH